MGIRAFLFSIYGMVHVFMSKYLNPLQCPCSRIVMVDFYFDRIEPAIATIWAWQPMTS